MKMASNNIASHYNQNNWSLKKTNPFADLICLAQQVQWLRGGGAAAFPLHPAGYGSEIRHY